MDIDFMPYVSYFKYIEPAAPLFNMRNSVGVFFTYFQLQSIFNLITKRAVVQLGKQLVSFFPDLQESIKMEQLVPQLTHQDTSKYINGNSTLHATQRCGPGRVFLFIKEFIYRNLRAEKRRHLFIQIDMIFWLQVVAKIEKALPKKNPFSNQVSSPAFTSGRGGSWPAYII